MIRIAFILLFVLCMAIAVAAIWISRQHLNTYTSSFHRYYFYYLVSFYTFAFYSIWTQLLMHQVLLITAGESDIAQQAAALLPLFGAPFLLFSWLALILAGHALVNMPRKLVKLVVYTMVFGLLLPAAFYIFLNKDQPFSAFRLDNMPLIIISGLLADLAFTLYLTVVIFRKQRSLAVKKRNVIRNFCVLSCIGFLFRGLIYAATLGNPWTVALAILLFFLSGIFPLLYLHRKADTIFMPIFAEASNLQKKQELFSHFGISPREQEIVAKICEGKTNQQIADELFISLQTVKDHTHRIYSKIGINSRLKLVQLLNG